MQQKKWRMEKGRGIKKTLRKKIEDRSGNKNAWLMLFKEN
jgi:hypothetical protein